MIFARDDIVGGKVPSHNKVESRNQEVSEPGMSIYVSYIDHIWNKKSMSQYKYTVNTVQVLK